MRADRSVFVNSNFGGAQLSRSSFVEAELTGCNLGGVDFAGATLRKATFRSCGISSTDLSATTLGEARFESCRFAGTTSLIGVDLTGVVFEHCSFETGAKLTTDNDSWRHAKLDPAALAAFEGSVAS
jgi:uncharacterized protein YjbI with pentapeptide repeats